MLKIGGTIESKHQVDGAPSEAPTESEHDISVAATMLTFIGALALIVSVFLPLDEPSSPFAVIQKNTLVQHEGWWLLAVGILIAIAALYSYFNSWRTWTTPVAALIAAGIVAYIATNKGLRTLYSTHHEGEGEVVPLGIAVYVAAAGAALALIGSWFTWATASRTARCPDCAEKVAAEAHVCKHCGHRLDGMG